jgi:hypothetical protein
MACCLIPLYTFIVLSLTSLYLSPQLHKRLSDVMNYNLSDNISILNNDQTYIDAPPGFYFKPINPGNMLMQVEMYCSRKYCCSEVHHATQRINGPLLRGFVRINGCKLGGPYWNINYSYKVDLNYVPFLHIRLTGGGMDGDYLSTIRCDSLPCEIKVDEYSVSGVTYYEYLKFGVN